MISWFPPDIGWVLVIVCADDHGVGRQVREVEGEGVGALTQLLDEARLELGLLRRVLLWGVDLDPVQHQLLLEAEAHHLLLLPAVPEGDHQLCEDPAALQGVMVVLDMK